MPCADPAGYRCWPRGCRQASLCLLQHQAPTHGHRHLTALLDRPRHAPAAQPELSWQRFGCHQAPPARGASLSRTVAVHGTASGALQMCPWQ